MASRGYTEREYNNVLARNAFAWKQVYIREDMIDAVMARELERPTTIQVIRDVIVPYRGPNGVEEPDVLPPHISREMIEMAHQLHRDYTCAVCLEMMTSDNCSMTKCGHPVCSECMEHIRENIPLAQGRPKCPVCRKKL